LYWNRDIFALISVPNPRLLDTCAFPTRREHLVYIPKMSVIPHARILGSSKMQIVDAIDWDAILFKVKQLSGALEFTLDDKEFTTKTRYTYSSDNLLSARFIKEYFEGLGFETMFQNFTYSGYSARNVIGVKIGTMYPDELVVIGAHFDSMSEMPNTNAPGANDDGSGTAAMMHLAELLSAVKTQRTIHFVAFGAEEQGLVGSSYYVSSAVKNKWKILNAICMDMISYSGHFLGVTVEGTTRFRELIDSVAYNMIEYSREKNFVTRTSTVSYGSDHVPFQQAGIPAILVIERDDTDTPYYHKTTDTWQTLNKEQTVAIMRGVSASICDLAGCL